MTDKPIAGKMYVVSLIVGRFSSSLEPENLPPTPIPPTWNAAAAHRATPVPQQTVTEQGRQRQASCRQTYTPMVTNWPSWQIGIFRLIHQLVRRDLPVSPKPSHGNSRPRVRLTASETKYCGSLAAQLRTHSSGTRCCVTLGPGKRISHRSHKP